MRWVDVTTARPLLAQGKVIAYPTEAVYGLGCDPFNQRAVEAILTLKGRASAQGLILLIADWSQLEPLIASVPDDRLDVVRQSWPGHVTWLFPKSERVPSWISGSHPSIAIRMTAHPVALALCQNGPLVSTSANVSGQPAIIDSASLLQSFPQGIDAIVEGELGGHASPSTIYDVVTGQRFR